MWRETTKHERNRVIWEEELADFIPERVLDFHVHVFARDTAAGGAHDCAGHALPQYEREDLDQDLGELFPGRETGAVIFGLPYPDHDLEKNNAYVGSCMDGDRFFPLYVLDTQRDSGETVEAALASGQFLGLKPYPDLAGKADVKAVEVHDMLPAWAMEAADRHGAIIMLHIPRSARLEDPLNLTQVRELCERYPNTRIVMAHIGRSYYQRCVEGNLDELIDLPNLYFDTAMVLHAGVLEYTFAKVPPERLLYGSDAPIALAPGTSVEINHQYTYITPVPWKLSISDDHGRLRFTSFHYEELRAIRRAVERLGLGRDFVEAFFYGNGSRVIEEHTARNKE
jgi:hypothetical protein